jgi:hypothetical protein
VAKKEQSPYPEPISPKREPIPAPTAAPPVVVELGLAKPPAQPDEPVDQTDADTRVTYDYRSQNDTLCVSYRLPYLENQRNGKMIRGISFTDVPFHWALPVLSVKVLNNSAQSVMLTECLVEASASTIDTEPVLAIAENTVNGGLIMNEGWGEVIDPVLMFRIHRLKKDEDSDTAERHTLELATFAQDKTVRLAKYVPQELRDESAVAVSGELEFGPAKQRKKVPFRTTMIFQTTFGSPVNPSQQYDLALTAGKAPAALRIPIAQNLKPGEADQFLLRVASDKSAHYELKLSLRCMDGQQLPAQKLLLDVFVPRTAAKRLEKPKPVEETRPEPMAKNSH